MRGLTYIRVPGSVQGGGAAGTLSAQKSLQLVQGRPLRAPRPPPPLVPALVVRPLPVLLMLAPLLRCLVFLLQGHTAVSGRLGERGRPRAPGGSDTSLPFFFFFFFSFAGGLPSLSAEETQRQFPGPRPGPPWAWHVG